MDERKKISFIDGDFSQLQAAQESELTAERCAQVDNVLRILQDSIEKLKISLILPRILENLVTLREFLSGSQYEKCVDLVQAYLRENRKQEVTAQLNYPLIKLIDIFHQNHKMMELLPNWLDDINMDDKTLLEAFELLQHITEQRLRKTAMSELSKEKKIHEVYHENESIKRNINEFEMRLRNQKINLRWKLAAKDATIQKYEEDLAYKKWDNNLRIKEEMVKSTHRIRSIHTASLQKQKELEEELEKAKATYDKILKQNLHQEKEARAEKNKLLLQLQALIRKYDQNIGEKIKENIYLEEQYVDQKRQFEEFLVEYQHEEAEYDAIVRAKEEEDRRKHEERLVLFMMNRAARVIQRYYRRYRREQKKKAKKAAKGKGKRK